MEYAVKAAIGHTTTPKGGTREYRNGPWYKSVYGKTQGERLGKKKKFGHGAYADKKTRFTTIEQNLSAVRKFYDDALRDTTVANPARNARLEKVRRDYCRRANSVRGWGVGSACAPPSAGDEDAGETVLSRSLLLAGGPAGGVRARRVRMLRLG